MRFQAGTSGYDYDEWKGVFYPEDLPKPGRLAYYAERLSTVEVNNTFYRIPKRDVVARWAEAVPAGFTFVLKASRRITHQARLVDTEETLHYLWRSASELGPHLGPILFQLPPYLRGDPDRLATFLAGLPDGLRAVVEVRHDSWRVPEVHEVLRAHGATLCVADSDEEREPEVVPTADFGYFRLRREAYSDQELAGWVERIRAQPWKECFLFFKHEDDGAAPRAARRLLDLVGE